MNKVFGFAVATVILTIGTYYIAPAMGVLHQDAFIPAVAVAFVFYVVAAACIDDAVKVANRWWIFMALCFEVATIAGAIALGASLAGPLVALLGIAALGGLWLVARRHAMPTLAPHSNGA